MSSQLQTNINTINSKIKKLVFTSNAIINHTEALPYIELEYIQSSGTQYINTEFKPNGSTRVQCKWSNGNRNGVIFGAYNGDWSAGFGLYGNEGGGNYWRHYFSNDDTKLYKQTSMTIDMNKGSLIMNDKTYFTNNTKTNSTSYPMYIFCGNWSGRIEQRVAIKLYYFKIYDNETLIRDFIPVKRKSDNVICLYDKISETFFTNQGTGTFVAGPEV